MSASLLLHCGAQEVTRDALDRIPAPAPTRSWFPLSHSHVLQTVVDTLLGAGFAVARERLGLMRDSARFFGVLDLECPVLEGVGLAVGVRNSTDKSFPIGFAAGSRVFVCDNLAFSAEVVVAKKHTRFGGDRFAEEMARIVQGLHQYREAEAARIRHWQERELTNDQADAYLLRAFERNIVNSRQLPAVIEAWREPRHEVFRPRRRAPSAHRRGYLRQGAGSTQGAVGLEALR